MYFICKLFRNATTISKILYAYCAKKDETSVKILIPRFPSSHKNKRYERTKLNRQHTKAKHTFKVSSLYFFCNNFKYESIQLGYRA